MLILSRRPGESIMLGDDMVVKVLDVRGAQVRLGIVAPAAVAVDRGEVWARKVIERGNASDLSNGGKQTGSYEHSKR